MKTMFGYFNNKYYATNEHNPILLLDGVDYTSEMFSAVIHENEKLCEVDMYRYHSDLTTECNANRVALMKEYIINEQIKNIEMTTDQLILSIKYELYNKDGKMIKSGTSEALATGYTLTIMKDIMENNVMEYRKALCASSFIEIPIPEISRYGIKNQYDQHPYTLKIIEMYLYTTTGGYKYIEANTQEDYTGCGNEHMEHCFYQHGSHICGHNPLIHNNFASHFITNAPSGNTIIGAMVTSATLQTPDEYTLIEMANFDCRNKKYTIKIDKKINLIRVRMEVLLDNFCVVHDSKDIQNLVDAVASDKCDNDKVDNSDCNHNCKDFDDGNGLVNGSWPIDEK